MKTTGWKNEIKRAVAILLLVTMLPFADFAGCFGNEVYGAALSNGNSQESVTGTVSVNKSGTGQDHAGGSPMGEEPAEMASSEQVPTMELKEDIKLEEDWNVTEEIVMTGGSLDLNGHTMTVSSNMIHSGGNIYFNGGKLIVEGDYRKQTRIVNEDGSYGYEGADSQLWMGSDEDYFLIKGDFYDDTVDSGRVDLNNGCLELKGSFYQSEEANAWSYYQNLFLISGEEKQVIHFKEGEDNISYIGKLKITNISEEGVVIEGNHKVYDSFESDRECQIEGTIYCTGYHMIAGGYYGGDVELIYGGFFYDSFEIGGDLSVSYYTDFYAAWTIGGNFYINDYEVGEHDDLTVQGDIYFGENGRLFIYEGNVTVKGNVTGKSTVGSGSFGIETNNQNTYVLIEGDYCLSATSQNYSNYNCGIMEVRGNLSFDYGVSFHSGATLILGGNEKQLVHVTKDCDFDHIEIQNHSEEGVCFEDYIYYEKLVTNGCHVEYCKTPVMSGCTLNEDMVIEGDVVLTGESVDLNGHTLTVRGNLIQKGIAMNVNGGKLIVEGDYSIGDPETMWDEKLITYSTGSLKMTDPEDYVLVYGDFYTARNCPGNSYCGPLHPDCASVLVNGTLEVKGDVVAKNEDGRTGSFSCTGSHTLLLSGSKGQRVWLDAESTDVCHLKITNTCEEGVEFIGEPDVYGVIDAGRDVHTKGLLKVINTERIKDGYYPGSVIISGIIDGDLEIGKDLIVRNYLNLKQAKLTVNGNVEIEEYDGKKANSMLLMEDAGAYLLVKGNFTNKSSMTRLEQGTLEVKGDFTDHCDITYGNGHRVLFSGTKLQTVVSKASLGIVELQNPVGVFSERAFGFYKLILNGCRLIIADEDGVIGFTLSDDYVVDGDLHLVAGVMDLNGHTLTVKGDLILQEGTLDIDHGSLIVEGDYRQQFRKKTEEGYEYSDSAGILSMNYDDDIMIVGKDFILMPEKSSLVCCEKGKLSIAGDMTIGADCAFAPNGTVIFNGGKKQKITAENPITFHNLYIKNTAPEGVAFEAPVTVTGSLSDEAYKAGGSRAVTITDLNNLVNGRFGGSLNLTSTCTLKQDLDIRGELSVNKGTSNVQLYCKDQKISVGNLKISQELYVQTGQIEVAHNLYTDSSGKIIMDQEEGYILVKGDVEFAKYGKQSLLNAGTLEVKGNYTDHTGGDYHIDHRILLSGSGLQTVSTSSRLGTLELDNHSEEGIYSDKTIRKKKLIQHGCRLTIGDGTGIYGFTLTEDYVVDGDLTLLDDTLDLNGHTMTVRGDLFLQEGTLKVNGGTLMVEGNLQLQSKYQRSLWESCGCLVMENEDDLVKIGKDLIIVNEAACNCRMEKGTIELGENLKRTDYYNHLCTIGCDLVLNGSDRQEISAKNLQLGNLIIRNQSEEGVSLACDITMNGSLEDPDGKLNGTGALCIQNLEQLHNVQYDGNVHLTGTSTLNSDVTVGGTLYVDGTLYCGKYTLKAEELVINGKLYTERGTVLVNGNMTVGAWGMLSMKKREAYVLVNGDVTIGDTNANRYQIHKNDLTDGVLEIKGNYMDYGNGSYGVDHKIILRGSTLQEVRVTGGLGTLELQNYSKEGVYSEAALKVLKMITNGCHYTIGEGYGIYGYTLTEDYVAAEDLILFGDTLDLNGRTMIVQGNLTLWDGELKINGGTLIVEGDLLIQRLSQGNQDGYGCLVMENENDVAKIGGNWIIEPGDPCRCRLEKGTIELQGDLIKRPSGYTDIYDIGCHLILNGKEKQTVSVSRNVQIKDLTLSNKSAEGICFDQDAHITGKVSDSAGNVNGAGSIVITDMGQLKDGHFGGNVILEGESTMENDISIDGTLQVHGVLHCGEYMLQAGTITADGQMYTDHATVMIEHGLNIENQGLFVMTEEEAYVLVKENLSFASTISHQGYLTNGVLEVLGNINVERYCNGFKASGGHYTIFRRRNVADPRIVKQGVNLKTGSFIHFARLELTKDFQSGYTNYYSSLEQMADEVIYVKAGTSIPKPVTKILSQEVTETTVTLSYEGNWDDGSLKGFMIYRNGKRIAMTAERSYQDSGLKPEETYTYTVYPYNIDRQTAKTAPELQVTTRKDTEAPKAPENLMVSVRSGSAVTLKWDKAKDNVAVGGYRLYRDGKLIYEGTAVEYKDTGLEENTLYTYEVKAYDTSGNESEAGKKVDGAVYMPKILSVTPGDYEDVGGDALHMSVRCKNGGNSTGNILDIAYYDASNKRWIEITRPSLGQSGNTSEYTISYTWDISDLAIENDVDVRFTLTDADGNKTEKTVTYVVDRKAPAAPENIAAEDDGGTVVVNWDISKSADCTGYELYRVNMQTGEGKLLAEISGRNSSWYRDSTVEDQATYHYYLRAFDRFGNISPMSEIAKVTVAEDTKAPRVTGLTPKSGKVRQCVSLVVSGSDNRAIAEFDLYMRRSSEEEWQLLTTVKARDDQGTFEWDTTGLEEGDYYIKAVARDKNGNENTDLFMRRYEVDNTGIAKIRLLDTTAGSTAVQLAWEDVTEEDFGWFVVEELIDEKWVEKGKVTDRLGYRLENLAPESTHTYRVTGYDLLGNAGIPSDTVTVMTLSDTTAPAIAAVGPVSSFYKDTIDLSMRVKDNGGVDHGVFSYSVSGNDFVEIATVSGNGGNDETLAYQWDISEIPEQKVTVRFEAYDTAGNHNALYENAQIENTYIIDRHAPEKVTGVHITGNEGCISLAWDSVSDNDVASYVIERAVVEEGIFAKIGETDSTLYYTDSQVKENVDYSYRISAKDMAGNIGEPSEEVWGTVKPDEEAPVVTGISPGTEIIGENPTLKVLAMDNAKLSEIILEYREAEETDIWHEIAVTEAEGREQYQSLTWNTDGLSEGTVYEVRAKAVDAAGNESEYVTRNYRLDLTPPKAPELTVNSGSFCIEMEFSENTEEDFRCYKIYRKEYGQKDYTCIQATTQNTFTDAVPETNTTYYYKVCALDIYGNCSESSVEHSYANNVDKIAPVAELPETMFGYTGMEIAFDGTLCSDNVRINRYEWDFGDGTIQTGVRPAHAYEKPGSYNVTLTVWDGAGNRGYTASVVQVMDKTNNGSAVIKVLGEDGNVLPGAYIYVKTGNGEKDVTRLRTDSKGVAKLMGKTGIFEYAAFAEGYLPEESTVRISNYETVEETVVLEKGEVVTANLTVERMELDEMLDKGVDLSAPENYHTYKFRTELWFASCPLPVVIDCTENMDGTRKTNSTNTGKSIGTYTQGNSSIQIELLNPEEEETETLINPAITYLQTTQTVSFMKDMYDVQLGIINNADSGYTITDASATLNLPDGLSLAATRSGQTLNTGLPDIDGQESASASWIVRGDKSGNYRLSASFHGVLQPFEADLDAQFEAETECVVPAGEGLHIYVYPEDAYYPGEDYYIQFEIKNESNRNFYNLKTSLGEYVQSSGIQEVFIKDINTGKVLTTQRTGGKTYRSVNAAKCEQLPVLYEGDIIDVGVFSPGETIYATYCQRMGAQTDPEYYYTLIDQLVTAIEGENLGVEVTVEPIHSHVYKYVALVGQRLEAEEDLDELMGDPVDMTTGAFLQELTTINLNGGNALAFDLHYNSMLADYESEVGYGWSHDYDQWIEDRGTAVILHMDSYTEASFINEEADGNISYGTLQGDEVLLDGETEYKGDYYPTGGVMEGWQLQKNEQGYLVTAPDQGRYTFDKEGCLTGMEDINGRKATLRHMENAMEIKDEITGESLYVAYDEEGMINSISDSMGRTVTLFHNGGNLTGITGLDGNTSVYAYDASHHLISATNAEGLTYVRNTYDGEGRVLTQREAAKAGETAYAYEDTAEGGMKISIADNTGESMEILTNEKGQKTKTKDVDGALAEYLYDRNGNLLDETDSYGNTVMYQYDEKDRLIRTYDTAGNITFTEYDENDNPVKVYDRDGTGTTFTYDEKNRLIRSVGPLGEVTRYAYDGHGNLIRRITDGKGTLQYEYAAGRLVSQTDGMGSRTTFEYDVYGNISKKTDALGHATLYNYNQAGQLISERSPDGTVISYSYDKAGQKEKTVRTAPGGSAQTERYAYDGAGRITKITDAAGNSTEYTYDSHGNKTSIIYPDGTRDSFAYDAGNNLIRKTTADGTVTEYTYDLNHNMLSEASGETKVSYEYYPNGKLYKQTLPDGQTYTYSYDSSWNCILVMDREGNSTGYTYDHAGNRTSVRDALGNTTKYTYDSYGRCIKITDPNGNSTSYAYDANDNCIRQTDALGNVTYMTYDALNRLIRTGRQTADGEISTSYTYDAMGRIISTTDEEGITTGVAYDAFGNVSEITDGEGNVVQTSRYDALGHMTETTDALGNTVEYAYDSLGNVTKITESPDSGEYSENTFVYDISGRMTAATDGAGNTASRTFDSRGNITSVTDVMGGKTGYSYDSMNRVTETVNAIGAKESYTYNAAGLLAEIKDNAGNKTAYTYDAAGRITKQKDEEGTIRYTYDNNGNILTVSDKNGTITRTYDALNRVTGVTDYKGDTITYGYDQLGNRISITYPGGEKVRYAYYKNGNLKTVTDAQGNVTHYTYDKNGRLTETVRGNGSRETRTYDTAGQLTGLKDETPAGEVISDYTYEYDGRGNITKITGMDAGISADLNPGTDTDGTTDTAPGRQVNEDGTITVSVSMTYDEDNRLLTYNGQTVEYDAAGNMTRGPLNGGMADFTYDSRNRLVKVVEGDGTVTAYEYDAENIRTAAITKGIRTEYTTDRESTYSQILVKTEYEKNVFGFYTEQKSRSVYTYGLGLTSEERDDKEQFYYHYNHLGSTMAVSDGDGNIVYRFVYDTYGELSDIRTKDGISLKDGTNPENREGLNTAETTEAAEAVQEITKDYTIAELAHAAGMEYLYNGQYGVATDRNGLYYMRARYYDQDIKRFINRDVVSGDLTNSQSLNRYCYVQGNPVSLTDPFGLCPDSNSAFKNLCIGIYHIDWNAVGHTALDIAEIFFESADILNAFWYACEGNMEMAAASAVSAIPGLGIGTGSLMMKTNKLAKAGRVIKTVSKLTQGGMGVAAGIEMAKVGFTNFLNGLESGTLDGKSLAMTFGDIFIAGLSGKGMVSSGRAMMTCTETAGRAAKGKGWLTDVDVSGKPIESKGMPTYRGQKVSKKSRRADFYVTPDKKVIPSTGYRYMSYDKAFSALNTGRQYATYISFDKFNSAAEARDALQISIDWSDCKVRGTFDTLQIIDDMYVPTTLGNTTNIPEPFTVSYPQYGKGGAQQYRIDKIIDFLEVEIIEN